MIILTACGAYNLHGYNFTDLENELYIHNVNNKKVVDLIAQSYPDLKFKIKTIIIGANDECYWL